MSERSAAPAPASPDPRSAWGPGRTLLGFHPNILALGLVSFFTDISSEMLVPVLPLFITATLGASVASLGLIEGVAECTASVLRLASGRVSDALGQRKPLVVAGYGLSGVCKTCMALAGSWPALLGMRFGDRVGKALRTPPRDALLADSTSDADLGRAFGVHRAMDTFGAALGPLVSWWLLAHWSALGSAGYRRVFLVSGIPSALALLVLVCLVRAPRPHPRSARVPGRIVSAAAPAAAPAVAPLGPHFSRFVVADTLFQLGNSSTAFLLLRAQQVGWSAGGVALVYLTYNLIAASLSLPFGRLSDRAGRRPLLLTGYLLYALAYGAAAFAPTRLGVVIAFVVLAVHVALMDGQGKSLISDLVPRERRATAFGAYGAAVGIALLPASIAAGLLWERVGPQAPFALGAALALAAALVFALLLPASREREARRA
jgi:MFS family permease